MNVASFSAIVDGATVLGFGLVAPLALGRWRAWIFAAAVTTLSLAVDSGPMAGAMATLVLVVAVSVTARSALDAGPLFFWRRLDAVRALAGLWATVAAGSLVASRLGLEPFGIHEPIVQLTAVHYLFAGTGAIALAGGTGSLAAVLLTAAAPPVVAVGFVTGWAVPQVGGALLMAAGVFVTAALELRRAFSTDERVRLSRRVLLAVSGLAVWVPMVLAVAWASGQHWDVPALSIPDMARWHGVPNALGFVVAGLAASRVHDRSAVGSCA